MSSLPAPLDESGLTSRQIAKAQHAQASAELELFRYGLQTQVVAGKDRADSQAIADASRAALEEEFDLLDYGLARSGGSAAKTAIVARKVERMATINDRRLTRRFGG